jgi:hypothetical protein
MFHALDQRPSHRRNTGWIADLMGSIGTASGSEARQSE